MKRAAAGVAFGAALLAAMALVPYDASLRFVDDARVALVIAVLLTPVVIVVHEAGHLAAARALGFGVPAVHLGRGRRIATGRLGATVVVDGAEVANDGLLIVDALRGRTTARTASEVFDLVDSGRLGEAVTRAQELAVQTAPGGPADRLTADVCNAVAYAALLSGDPTLVGRVLPLAERAVSGRPGPETHDTFAWALIEHGAIERGLELNATVLVAELSDTDRAAVLCVRAIGSARAGQRGEAHGAMELAARLDPRCALLLRARDELGSSTPT
jgi:hypothetical protein